MSDNPSFDLLTVKNLSAGYSGISVLRDINLHVSEGECVGLFGHNGMGKSTLLRTLIGLIRPLSGSIEFDGQDITHLPTWKRARLGIGYLPQGRGIFPGLSVSDNVGIAYNPDTRDKDEQSALEGAIARFPTLEPLLKQAGGTLSGGEQQILALARALTADPVMLLLDEPTEGIQPSIVMKIANELAVIAKNTGLTILMVEQNIDFLNVLADRVLHIENGRIAEQERRSSGNAVQPKSQPLNPRTETPVSASNSEQRESSEITNEPILEKQMAVSRPTIEQMQKVSSGLHFHIDRNALTEYLDLSQSTIDAYDIVDAMPDELPEVKYPRTSGHIPAESENALNAWYVKCDISGSPDGPLRNKPVVLKDTICLSGIRMMNGASIMDGYVPDI
ncbi:MAG: ATP-binding cassette domain-containing protein, partial [Gammaproteobacteria bacterium]|nr:ATP-binding cassette domain-containing protein [Gammaproteobacteria bacterium]